MINNDFSSSEKKETLDIIKTHSRNKRIYNQFYYFFYVKMCI